MKKLIQFLLLLVMMTCNDIYFANAETDLKMGTYSSSLSGNLVYQEAGKPDGLPIVFIHGFPFDHKMWNSQVEFFKNKFRVITYDLRGMGKSEDQDGQFTLEILVDDLMALLDHLKIDKAQIVG